MISDVEQFYNKIQNVEMLVHCLSVWLPGNNFKWGIGFDICQWLISFFLEILHIPLGSSPANKTEAFVDLA